MTTAIGVVITDRIVTGRLEDQRLTGNLLRYPSEPETNDALAAIPDSELIEILTGHIASLASGKGGPVEAIGVAVPGIVLAGVVEACAWPTCWPMRSRGGVSLRRCT
jgi:hypothetical protein